MTTPRLVEDALADMLEASSKARSFVEGLSFEAFCDDARTQYAVIRALEIIGEAARRVPPDFRAAHPEFPWREMTGMRDKLIHGYFGVSLEVVWRTLQRDLPPLQSLLEALREGEE